MSWANLDDRFHSHPKVRRLQRLPDGAEALGIWAWCLSWCRAYSPIEGRLAVEDVAYEWHVTDDHMTAVMGLLARVGLVDQREASKGHDYVIHDWADWQLAGRERQSLAGKLRASTAVRQGGRFAPDPADVDNDVDNDGKGPEYRPRKGRSQTQPTSLLERAGNQPGHSSPLPSTKDIGERRGGDSSSAGEAGGVTEFSKRVPRPPTPDGRRGTRTREERA